MLNPDFRDMLSAFNAERVEYLVVGAYAMAQYGYVRATGDLDFWIHRTPENADRVLGALAAFGAPRGLVKRSHLLKPDIVVQVGVEPSRVDILTSIDGVKFEAAYKARTETEVGGVRVPFVSLAHLIQNKRATGRERDQSDVAMLQAATKRQKAR